MTGEETKQLKERFKKKFYDGERFLGGEDLWQFIESEIITPYEKQLSNNKYEVDHSIDVRYEEDLIKAFNKFIKKWCGPYYPHLIDSDEQDGQFMREKIAQLQKQLEQVEREKDEIAHKRIADNLDLKFELCKILCGGSNVCEEHAMQVEEIAQAIKKHLVSQNTQTK